MYMSIILFTSLPNQIEFDHLVFTPFSYMVRLESGKINIHEINSLNLFDTDVFSKAN